MSRDNCRCRCREEAPHTRPGVGYYPVPTFWELLWLFIAFLIMGLIAEVLINGWCSVFGCVPFD